MVKRRTLASFIEEAINRYKETHPDATETDIARTLLDVDPASLSKWKKGKIQNITIPNIEAVLGLLDLTLGDCLYFPNEVSHYRAVEVAIYGPPPRKKPSG